ncbi:hypothetical protein HDU96_004064, partial [Phlyctochytrium bullatum]
MTTRSEAVPLPSSQQGATERQNLLTDAVSRAIEKACQPNGAIYECHRQLADRLERRIDEGLQSLTHRFDALNSKLGAIGDACTGIQQTLARQDRTNNYIEKRSSIRLHNASGIGNHHPLIPLPTDNGTLPEGFPHEARAFTELNPDSVDPLLEAYGLLDLCEWERIDDEEPERLK